MKIQVIPGTNAIFNSLAKDIINIYVTELGETFYSGEGLQIKHPESIFLVKPEQSTGGIIINQYHGYEHLASIMYAAFPKSDRGQGYLKACIQIANQFLFKRNSRIVSVEVNPFDDKAIWRHLGFTHDAMVNLVQTLFNEDPEPLFNEEDKRRDGIPLDDLKKLIGNSELLEALKHGN